jgi:hypothetical protein
VIKLRFKKNVSFEKVYTDDTSQKRKLNELYSYSFHICGSEANCAHMSTVEISKSNTKYHTCQTT